MTAFKLKKKKQNKSKNKKLNLSFSHSTVAEEKKPTNGFYLLVLNLTSLIYLFISWLDFITTAMWLHDTTTYLKFHIKNVSSPPCLLTAQFCIRMIPQSTQCVKLLTQRLLPIICICWGSCILFIPAWIWNKLWCFFFKVFLIMFFSYHSMRLTCVKAFPLMIKRCFPLFSRAVKSGMFLIELEMIYLRTLLAVLNHRWFLLFS